MGRKVSKNHSSMRLNKRSTKRSTKRSNKRSTKSNLKRANMSRKTMKNKTKRRIRKYTKRNNTKNQNKINIKGGLTGLEAIPIGYKLGALGVATVAAISVAGLVYRIRKLRKTTENLRRDKQLALVALKKMREGNTANPEEIKQLTEKIAELTQQISENDGIIKELKAALESKKGAPDGTQDPDATQGSGATQDPDATQGSDATELSNPCSEDDIQIMRTMDDSNYESLFSSLSSSCKSCIQDKDNERDQYIANNPDHSIQQIIENAIIPNCNSGQQTAQPEGEQTSFTRVGDEGGPPLTTGVNRSEHDRVMDQRRSKQGYDDEQESLLSGAQGDMVEFEAWQELLGRSPSDESEGVVTSVGLRDSDRGRGRRDSGRGRGDRDDSGRGRGDRDDSGRGRDDSGRGRDDSGRGRGDRDDSGRGKMASSVSSTESEFEGYVYSATDGTDYPVSTPDDMGGDIFMVYFEGKKPKKIRGDELIINSAGNESSRKTPNKSDIGMVVRGTNINERYD